MKLQGDFAITGLDELIDKVYSLDNALNNEMEMLAIQIAEIAVSKAKELCVVDTSVLRNSITYNISQTANEITITVYTNVEYSEFIEFGTGTKGDPSVAHVQKDKWVYYSEARNQFITAYAQAPRPFMYPAFIITKQLIPGLMTEYLLNRITELLGEGTV